jgi:hypothetical protein
LLLDVGVDGLFEPDELEEGAFPELKVGLAGPVGDFDGQQFKDDLYEMAVVFGIGDIL